MILRKVDPRPYVRTVFLVGGSLDQRVGYVKWFSQRLIDHGVVDVDVVASVSFVADGYLSPDGDAAGWRDVTVVGGASAPQLLAAGCVDMWLGYAKFAVRSERDTVLFVLDSPWAYPSVFANEPDELDCVSALVEPDVRITIDNHVGSEVDGSTRMVEAFGKARKFTFVGRDEFVDLPLVMEGWR